MPGFIDAHRHFNTGPNEKAQMQAQLEAGYTTLLSGGGPADGNITLRDRIESGQINGPRIIPSGRAAPRPAHAGVGARRDPQDGGDGRQVHRRDLADADARARPRRRWTCCARSWTKARRPA